MKVKNYSIVLFSLISISAIAAGPTAPTKPSTPIPTVQETQNIDTVLTEKVQANLAKTPALKNQSVSAASHEQVVTLEGSVENKEQEKAAIKAAKSVKGVKQVKSQLTIKLLPGK